MLTAYSAQLFSQTGGAIKVIKVDGNATSSMSNSGVLANQTLYVAGQDGRNADGSLPEDFQQEVSQSLSSVQAVLRAAGMDFGNVVWMNVYLTRMSNMDAMNSVYWKMIGTNPPARTILGVAELPHGESIEINCIAASNAVHRVVIHPPLTGRLPSDYSGEVKQALDNVATIAKVANMSMANVVWVNPYWTSTGNPSDSREMSKIYATYFEFGNTPGRGTRQMAELPNKTHIVFSCIAGADLAKRKAIRPVNEVPSATASPGVIYGDTYYMSGKNAFVPALGLFTSDLILQFRYVIRNLLDDLQAADMDFSNVVSSNLYMREMKDTDQVEPLYLTFFKDHLPAQALLENNLDLKSESAVEMSLIAVRQPKK